MADFAEPLRLAEKSVASRRDYPSLKTLAAALYRAKRYEDSIKKFDEAIKVHGQGGTAADWLFLAMAHHHLGHMDEANKWLTKAQQWLDHTHDIGPVVTSLPWDEHLELKLIRAEAEALMKEEKAKK